MRRRSGARISTGKIHPRAEEADENCGDDERESKPEVAEGIRPATTLLLPAFAGTIWGRKTGAPFKPNDAPAPGRSMRLGLIGLKMDATVMTTPPER
jgi:hypothetical protein